MIVLGLGFGDEGKGQTVSYLCSRVKRPLVVRFNGGHQAGHTVYWKDKRHVFSSFGSGTLQGAPTYWGPQCTFYPLAFMNEWYELDVEMGVSPTLFIHPMCPVTTPYDVQFNRRAETSSPVGSVGVGFGATLQRHEAHFKLFVKDLFHDSVLDQKLRTIASYYNEGPPANRLDYDIFDSFIEDCQEARQCIFMTEKPPSNYENIYEGQCGIMMDQDYGFFPHVTRSSTTSKNAIEDMSYNTRDEVMYVTRTYQTRHGLGHMTNEHLPTPKLVPNLTMTETNVAHPYQGEFRKTVLDIDLLRYALDCDVYHSGLHAKNLMITCVDQTGQDFEATLHEDLIKINVRELAGFLKPVEFNNVYMREGHTVTRL